MPASRPEGHRSSRHTIPDSYFTSRGSVDGATAEGLENLRHPIQHEFVSLRPAGSATLSFDALLDAFYAGLIRAFPNKNERFSIGQIRQHLVGDGHLHVTLCMHGRSVVGGCVWSHFDAGGLRWSAIENIFVNGPYRHLPQKFGEGILREVEIRTTLLGAKFVLAEINDPLLMTDKQKRFDQLSGISPDARLRWWDRMGYLAVDAPYVQPPLTTEMDDLSHLLLAIRPLQRFGHQPFEFSPFVNV